MKICPNCHTQLEDDAAFCYQCGTRQTGPAAGAQETPEQDSAGQERQNAQSQQYRQPPKGAPYQQYQQPYQTPRQPDPYDHTAEFDAKDISDNKIFAMACYLLDVLGIIIALLASDKSEYARFHVRQVLKITIANILVGIAAAVLCWTVVVPVAGAVCAVILLVLRIIGFVQVCQGKAKEVYLLRSLPFMT